jgi:hypothetical protein
MDEWIAAHDEAWTTPPQEITEEQWWDALECLPPEAWKRGDHWETFRMMEYLSGTVTAHYIRKGNRYYVTNRPATGHLELLALIP